MIRTRRTTVSADLALDSGPHELRVQLERGRLRLDVVRLSTLAHLVRTARSIGGLRSLLARLPAREVELALRGRVFARRTGGSLGWRLHPLGLLRGLGARA
jgi:hypothetical protein